LQVSSHAPDQTVWAKGDPSWMDSLFP
jgi:hypothetical protein